jgi:hypothetical protein
MDLKPETNFCSGSAAKVPTPKQTDMNQVCQGGTIQQKNRKA